MSGIRTVQFEADEHTGARSIVDIREFPAPAAQRPGASFTTLSKDLARRELLVAVSRQIDDLLEGRCTEISIVLKSPSRASSTISSRAAAAPSPSSSTCMTVDAAPLSVHLPQDVIMAPESTDSTTVRTAIDRAAEAIWIEISMQKHRRPPSRSWDDMSRAWPTIAADHRKLAAKAFATLPCECRFSGDGRKGDPCVSCAASDHQA